MEREDRATELLSHIHVTGKVRDPRCPRGVYMWEHSRQQLTHRIVNGRLACMTFEAAFSWNRYVGKHRTTYV